MVDRYPLSYALQERDAIYRVMKVLNVHAHQ
jgi:hypothetical protein